MKIALITGSCGLVGSESALFFSKKGFEIIGIENNASVESFSGLIVDFARSKNANILIKGVRGPVDYDYELQMAGMNSTMNPDIETIFLISRPEFSYISSSLVKQIAFMSGDYSNFVSQIIQDSIKQKI